MSINSQKDLKEKLGLATSSRKEELPHVVVEETTQSTPIIQNNPLPTLGKRKREVSRSRTATPSRTLRHLLFDNEPSGDTNPPGPVWIFFSTLRELFIKNSFEISLTQLGEEFTKDEQKLACIPASYTLHQFLLLGLNFLHSPPLVNASESEKKRKARSRKSSSPSASTVTSPSIHNSETPPSGPAPVSEYQSGGPFVSFDETKDKWRWTGVVSGILPFYNFTLYTFF